MPASTRGTSPAPLLFDSLLLYFLLLMDEQTLPGVTGVQSTLIRPTRPARYRGLGFTRITTGLSPTSTPVRSEPASAAGRVPHSR
jgi:hypothetical protein